MSYFVSFYPLDFKRSKKYDAFYFVCVSFVRGVVCPWGLRSTDLYTVTGTQVLLHNVFYIFPRMFPPYTCAIHTTVWR